MVRVIERMAWDLEFAGRSARTRKVYLADARSFLGFWGRPWEECGQGEVRAWVEHLIAAGTSPSRLRQHLSALVQYGSLKRLNEDGRGAAGIALDGSVADVPIAHFTLDAPGIGAVSTGTGRFFHKLLQDGGVGDQALGWGERAAKCGRVRRMTLTAWMNDSRSGSSLACSAASCIRPRMAKWAIMRP